MNRGLFLFLILLIPTFPCLATPPAPEIYSLSPSNAGILAGQEVFIRACFSDTDTGESYTIKWDMGDGTVEQETLSTTHDNYANPGRCSPYRHGCFALVTAKHTYNEPGSYKISLLVTDSKGENGTDSVPLQVMPAVMSPGSVLPQKDSTP